METEWIVEHVSAAEHPLIAGESADALADLVGQGLKGEAAIGVGQGAAESGADLAGLE